MPTNLDIKKYGNLQEKLSSTSRFEIPPESSYFPDTSTRCVEIPLIFSTIRQEQKILDVGISLADQLYFYGLTLLIKQGRELHGLDIVPFEKVLNRFDQFKNEDIERIHFTQGDIRHCPLPSSVYDMILCVSVLEHVGFDKYLESQQTVFDRPFTKYASLPDFYSWTDDTLGLNEMIRLLKYGGRLLLTVPFGTGGVYTSKDSKGRFAAHLEYNREKWFQLKDSIQHSVAVNERVFQMFSDIGWQEVTLDTTFPIISRTEKHFDQGVLCAEITKNNT